MTDKFTINGDLIKYDDGSTIADLNLTDACSVLNSYHEHYNILLKLIKAHDKELYKKISKELIDLTFAKLMKGD